MNAELEIRLANLEEHPQIARILSQAFNRPRGYYQTIISRYAAADLWVSVEHGRVQGVIRARPAAQFFGGRRVTVVMVRTVAMAAHSRGRGLLKTMIQAVLEHYREQASIAILSASTAVAYQRSWFDVAGIWPIHVASIESVPTWPDAIHMEPFGVEAFADVADCHRRFGAQHNGILERTEDWWKETELHPAIESENFHYLVRDSGTVTGYVIFSQRPITGRPFPYTLSFSDLVWTDLRSLRAILTFIAGHRALADGIEWSGPPNDVVLSMLARGEILAGSSHTWMARAVNPKRALQERGYDVSVSAETSLIVDEPLLMGDASPIGLRVGQGEAQLDTPEVAKIHMDPGTFGAIFTGWLHPRTAYSLGRLPGASEADVRSLTEMFAGPLPWSIEHL